MSAASGRHHDPQQREGRLNRRNALFTAMITALGTLGGALVGAVVTAHSSTVTNIFGGQAAPSKTVAATPRPPAGTPVPSGPQLPSGGAFTEGSFQITNSGIDLDRNPPEAENISNGQPELDTGDPAPGLFGAGSLEVAKWQGQGLPSQTQCHDDELSNGTSGASTELGLTDAQQTKTIVRLCILTSEGRDAYVVVSGNQIGDGSSIQASAFVWPSKIPVQ